MALRNLKSKLSPDNNQTTQTGHTNIFRAVAVDEQRIFNYLKTPGGLFWNIKQFGLQLSNPKTEEVVIRGTRLFNPLSVLVNTLTAPFGIRVPRHGLPLAPNYEDVIKTKIDTKTWNLPKVGIRSIQLLHEFGYANMPNELEKGESKAGKIAKFISSTTKFLTNLVAKTTGRQPILAISGLGGPNAPFGVGITTQFKSNVGVPYNPAEYTSTQGGTIKFLPTGENEYRKRIGIEGLFKNIENTFYNNINPVPGSRTVNKNGEIINNVNILESNDIKLYNSLTYKELLSKKSRIHGSSRDVKAQELLKESYKIYPKKARSGKGKSKNDDVMGSFPVRFKTLETGAGDIINKNNSIDNNDFVKLVFYGSETPTNTNGNFTSIQFRGYIKGLTDKFNPTWEEINYIGRPDPVYNYKTLTRDISFNFIVAAFNQLELNIIWNKCNNLSQLVSPSFSSYGNMSGPIIGLKIGNYLSSSKRINKLFSLTGGHPGHIGSLTYTIEDDYPWDVEKEIPMYVKIDISFQAYGIDIFSNKENYFGVV